MSEANIQQILQVLSVALIPGILAITLHEVAHGWAAKQLGDPTAYMLGRLSLNPLKHVDPDWNGRRANRDAGAQPGRHVFRVGEARARRVSQSA